MTTKKSTILFIFIIAITWAGLFYIKYTVMSIEDRIRIAKRDIILAQKNLHILKAEWKSLISPERLQRLVKNHLNMQQLEPKQLKEFDPAIFHSDETRYKETKKLSELVKKIMSEEGD